jgi:hypothetical protein
VAGFRTLSPRNLQSRSYRRKNCQRSTRPQKRNNAPDGPHQTVHKELVLLRRGLLPCVPHFRIAALHQPSLEIDGVSNVWVTVDLVRGERQRLEGRVEVGYPVLSEETNEVKPADRKFAFRWGKDGTMKVYFNSW